MPVYVYRRRDGSTFETQQRMAEEPLVDCPTTGQTVERVLQPFTPRYSGTGFYSTDHLSRSPGPVASGKADCARSEDALGGVHRPSRSVRPASDRDADIPRMVGPSATGTPSQEEAT